jgi:plastocyanin
VTVALFAWGPARAADHRVEVSNFVFSPREIVVLPGDTVTWENRGGGSHNVVADDGSFRCAQGCDGEGGDGSAAPGPWRSTRTFTEIGPVGYFCDVHGTAGGTGMAGRVEVADPAALGACQADATTLCLTGGRFRVRVRWQTAEGEGQGQAVSIPGATDSGLFWFFAPANLEILVKVLDGCAVGARRYWVFFAPVTDVGLTLEVADTANGRVRTYTNRRGEPARTVLDTDAFPTCGRSLDLAR